MGSVSGVPFSSFLSPPLAVGLSSRREGTGWIWRDSSALSPILAANPGGKQAGITGTPGTWLSKRVSPPPGGFGALHSLAPHSLARPRREWWQPRAVACLTLLGSYLKEPESPVSGLLFCAASQPPGAIPVHPLAQASRVAPDSACHGWPSSSGPGSSSPGASLLSSALGLGSPPALPFRPGAPASCCGCWADPFSGSQLAL